MDYSAVEDQPDASPWASSPHNTRTTFEEPVPDSPGFAATDTDSPERTRMPTDETPQPPSEQTFPAEPSSSGEQPGPAQQTQQARQSPKKAKQDRPRHKLQAKITNLIRHGRKDPILEFDVYVSDQEQSITFPANPFRPISQNSALPNTET